MNRMKRMGFIRAGITVLAAVLQASAAPPPPPPGGGTIKPPDAPPPGTIYFEDNVVIIGPGFVKPDADGGTVFVDLTKVEPDPITRVLPDPTPRIRQLVEELTLVKGQVEAATGAIPGGLLNPASLAAVFDEPELTAGRGVFDDPAFLHEDVGGGEAAAPDRTEQARSGGMALQVAPDAPMPTPAVRRRAADRVTPSYWQLPIR